MPSTVQNLYNPIVIGYLPLTALPTRPTTGAQDSQELGLYALDRITFSPQWQLVVGARHTHFESTQGASATIPLIAFDVRKTHAARSAQLQVHAGPRGLRVVCAGCRGRRDRTCRHRQPERPHAARHQQAERSRPALAHRRRHAAVRRAVRHRAPGCLHQQRQHLRGRRAAALPRSRTLGAGSPDPRTRVATLGPVARCRVPRHQRAVQREDAREHRQANGQRLPLVRHRGGSWPVDQRRGVLHGAASGRRPEPGVHRRQPPSSAWAPATSRSCSASARLWQINIDNVGDKRYWAAAGTRLAVGAPRSVKATLKIDL
jgi:iron complex outermembrane receptor protein